MKTDLVVAGYAVSNGKVLLIHHRKLDLWLPPGGHIEADETPDDALVREMREETGLDVEILNRQDMPVVGNVKRNLAIPFHVNVHSVKDHDHCCFFYVCRAKNPGELRINAESKGAEWFDRKALGGERVPPDVRNQCLKALEMAGGAQ